MAIEVLYSPPAGIPARIAELIDAATATIDLAMYHFTESTLARTLGRAVDRGVLVRAILDYGSSWDTNSMSWTLARKGVHTFTDHFHSILHTKWCIIDSATLLTGSANWSYNSDGDAAEDLLIITEEPALVDLYKANWRYHRTHSVPLPRSPR